MNLNSSKLRGSKAILNSSSWTVTDDEPVKKYDHVWSVVNFDRKMGMENGRSIKSGNFRITFMGQTSDWNLEMYPNGSKEEYKGYVS